MRTLVLLLLSLCACAPAPTNRMSDVPSGELVLAASEAAATPLVLDVRVVDAQGTPLEGVRVRLEQDDGVLREHPDAGQLQGQVTSDIRGGAVFYTVLPTGPLRVNVDGRVSLALVFDREATAAGQRSVSLVQDEAGILYGSTVVEL